MDTNTQIPTTQVSYSPAQNTQTKRKKSGFWKFGCFSFLLLLCCCFTSTPFIWAVLPTDTFSALKISKLETVFGSSTKESLCRNIQKDTLLFDSLNCQIIIQNLDTESTSSSTTGDNSTALTSTSSSKNTTNNSAIGEYKLKEYNLTEKELVELIDKTSKSVVTIVASDTFNPDDYYQTGSTSSDMNIGSGFIIRQDGLIITNNHVVEDENIEYSVLLPGETTPIAITKIYRSPSQDIALIKINKTNLPTLILGDSANLKRGQSVIAIGSSLGELTNTVTTGIISGTDRTISIDSNYSNYRTFTGVIQTDAAINPGNSGGPLVNLSGEVIGINFAITENSNNIGFVLPIDKVKLKLAEFEKYGKFLQPYVGIQSGYKNVYFINNEYISGIAVLKVVTDSPAEKMGILRGDIIVSVNGKSVKDAFLADIIQSQEIGSKVKFEIWRKGESKKLIIEVNIVDYEE